MEEEKGISLQEMDGKNKLDEMGSKRNMDGMDKTDGRECRAFPEGVSPKEVKGLLEEKDFLEEEDYPEEEGLQTGEAVACGCHKKATPRDQAALRQLKNRLNRMAGQLSGIGNMLDENRYCGDILVQVAAVESALQSFGYLILKEHMETCVVEEIRKGNTAVVEEAVELMKKLK